MRFTFKSLLLLLLPGAMLFAATSGHALSAPAPAAGPAYYLALGDSLAAGVTKPGVPTDPGCTNPKTPGYVCVFYRYLLRVNPTFHVRNFAVSGANSCVLVHGLGGNSPCSDPLLTGAAPSQVDEALQFIQSHSGQVNVITLDVGGDDFLAALVASITNPSAALQEIPAILTSDQTDLDSALQQLHAAAPQAKILVINQYNPIGGASIPLLPTSFVNAAGQALDGLAAIDQSEAEKYGATYVDVASAFNHAPGGAASLTYAVSSVLAGNLNQINVHPTPQGYAVYAHAVISASGYNAPLVLKAHLADSPIKKGAKGIVRGRSVPFDALTLRVKLPGGASRTVHGSVAEFGGVTVRFAASSKAGQGSLQLCVRGASAQKKCRSLSFTVR